MTKLLMDKVAQAKKVISEQCVNSRWQMCIPPQADDSDIVLCDTIDILVAIVERQAVTFNLIVKALNNGDADLACSIAQDTFNEIVNFKGGYKYEVRHNFARPIFEEDPKKYSDQIDAELREVGSLA